MAFRAAGAHLRFRSVAAALISICAMLGTVQAQQPQICRQINAELAGGASRAEPAALQQAGALRQQYAQIQRSLAQLQCQSGGSAYAPTTNPQCTGLQQQAAALSARVQALESGAQRSGVSPQRRATLMAALESNGCYQPARPETARRSIDHNATGTVTGSAPRDPNAPQYSTAYDPTAPFKVLDEQGRKVRADGQRLAELAQDTKSAANVARIPVCVRSCDGYFFPVNYQGAEGKYNDVCRASCPGASAELYWMPSGGAIEAAVSARGGAYTALANASAYRKAFNAACSCKRPMQAWGNVLQNAESLIRRKGDIIVTQASSLKMAMPNASGTGATTETAAAQQTEAEDDTPEEKLAFRDADVIDAVVAPSLRPERSALAAPGNAR